MKRNPAVALVQRTIRWFSSVEPVVLIALLLMVLGLWAFFEIADSVQEAPGGALDREILLAFRTPADRADPIGPPWLADMARDLTALGGPALLLFFTAAVCGYLALERKHAMLTLVLLAVGSGLVLSLGLKSFFQRPRPSAVPYLANISTSSFPSGHSMMAAVVYLTLGILLASALPRRSLKLYVLTMAVTLTTLVGISRVFLGVHYPTDVLAGWAAGLVWALLCWVAGRWLQRRGALPEADEPGSDW